MPALASVGGPSGDEPEDIDLPELRQDIEIIPAAATPNGAPGWMLFDPYRSAYFRIDRSAFFLLSNWGLRRASKVRAAAQGALGLPISEDAVGGLVKFLFANHLTRSSMSGGSDTYLENHKRGQRSLISNALHSYLFFKIPLFRPEAFLNVTWPWVRPLFSTGAVVTLVCMGVIALYLVSRQWDSFQDQLMSLLSWRGAAIYGISLVFVKVVHELGHAYMARRHGVTVPVIGVAFLLLMPIMYTDTSNAWRLRQRSKRLMIDGAGIMAELMLAVIATLFWVFLPDGAMRSVAFSVAAVSWVLSLAVNLNPFMRFDGYYILSDAIGIENLQARGFALAKWRMREVFFGLGRSAPEYLPGYKQRFVILHAWCTWIYRFFLFLGIALLVYHLFAKVLGIFLFVVEICFFIVLPIAREIGEWIKDREAIMNTRRSRVGLLILASFALMLFLPLLGSVRLPAVLHAKQEFRVYPNLAAQISSIEVNQGMRVNAGDVLVRLHSEQLELDTALAGQRRALLETRLVMASQDTALKVDMRVIERELASVNKELLGLAAKRRELDIVSELDGVVVDLDRTLRTGQHVATSKLMFIVRATNGHGLTGFVNETDVSRLEPGVEGRFVPDNPRLASVPVKLAAIRRTSVAKLDHAELAELHGGSVPVEENTSKETIVRGSYYQADLEPVGTARDTGQTVRGEILLAAERRSLARIGFERVWSVLIRETGF
ncbi:MAG: site-2 protease family protein [Pseudomonadota bacterium]